MARPYRGKDRYTRLVPVRGLSVGKRVFWQKTWYIQGVPSTRWWMGLIEVKRGSLCIVRDRHGHEHVVGVSALFEEET